MQWCGRLRTHLSTLQEAILSQRQTHAKVKIVGHAILVQNCIPSLSHGPF